MSETVQNMISALVINLPQSVERWAFQKNQLGKLGIPLRRLNAVAIADVASEHYEALANGWERKLRPAEVACFLSHRRAWQAVIDADAPLLILEDDALLSQHTPELLAALAGDPQQADLLTLETRSRKKLLDKQACPAGRHFHLRRLYQDRTGAAAYLLYPSGAHKLLAKAQTRAPALADAFISSCYPLNACQVVPAAAIQLDQCQAYGLPFANPFASTITPPDQYKPAANNPTAAGRFKWRRIVAQIKMGVRQLSVQYRSRREYVGIVRADFTLPPSPPSPQT